MPHVVSHAELLGIYSLPTGPTPCRRPLVPVGLEIRPVQVFAKFRAPREPRWRLAPVTVSLCPYCDLYFEAGLTLLVYPASTAVSIRPRRTRP